MRDRSLPKPLELTYEVLDILRDNERRGRISAVHCRGGIGRTGMVVGCWLVDSGYARDGAEALRIIAREWQTVEKCKRYPQSPETGSQCDYVLNFHPKDVVDGRLDTRCVPDASLCFGSRIRLTKSVP